MRIKSGKLATFSLMLNVLLLLAGSAFVAKRWYFQYQADHPVLIARYQDNPQFAEQVNIEAAYTRPEKIIMLGNSLVYKAHWDELLNRGDVGNRGIGSDITAGYLHRLQYVFDSRPAICFIEAGVNDVWYHVPVDSTISHLALLVDTLEKTHIIPVLHKVAPLARSCPEANRFNPIIVQLNVRIGQLAQQKGVDCIDLYSLLSRNGYLAPTYAQEDGIHFTAAAYLEWKTEIEQVLLANHI